MIGYVTLGTSDLVRAGAFYDDVLSEMNIDRLYAGDREIYWGDSTDGAKFAVTLPFDGNPASAGNGVMIALKVADRDTVERVHARALALGAADEGAVGPRGDGSFFGGYFRDADGHKICVYVT